MTRVRFGVRRLHGVFARAFLSDTGSNPPVSALVAAPDLVCVAYCPRQLYYTRRDDDRTPSPAICEIRVFALGHPGLLDATNDGLASRSISVPSAAYHEYLVRLREHGDWDALTDPVARDELLADKDCRGVAHKLVDAPDDGGDRPPVSVPSLVSSGGPPERGIQEPQRIRAITLAKAFTWKRGAPVPRALVEYPAVDVVRTVGLMTGNKVTYRRALRVVRDLDFVPSRLRDSTRCESCTYRKHCGAKTWPLSSLLGRWGRRPR